MRLQRSAGAGHISLAAHLSKPSSTQGGSSQLAVLRLRRPSAGTGVSGPTAAESLAPTCPIGADVVCWEQPRGASCLDDGRLAPDRWLAAKAPQAWTAAGLQRSKSPQRLREAGEVPGAWQGCRRKRTEERRLPCAPHAAIRTCARFSIAGDCPRHRQYTTRRCSETIGFFRKFPLVNCAAGAATGAAQANEAIELMREVCGAGGSVGRGSGALPPLTALRLRQRFQLAPMASHAAIGTNRSYQPAGCGGSTCVPAPPCLDDTASSCPPPICRYVLANIEGRPGGMWQIACGSSFGCNRAVWRACAPCAMPTRPGRPMPRAAPQDSPHTAQCLLHFFPFATSHDTCQISHSRYTPAHTCIIQCKSRCEQSGAQKWEGRAAEREISCNERLV